MLPDGMIEDAQPNERSFSRKGAAIPMVRSSRWSTANQCKTPNYLGRTPATTNNSQQAGTYNSNHSQRSWSNYSYGSDTWRAKRRRIGHSGARLSHTPYSKAQNVRKPEPTELLVDIPPECRKGAPGCQKLRKQWVFRQIKEIQMNIGVKVQFCGYMENSVRFSCSNDQPPVVPVIGSAHHQVDVGSKPDTDLQDEIIIPHCTIDVDAELDEGMLVHPSDSADREQCIIPIDEQGVLHNAPQGIHPGENTAAPPPSTSETAEPQRVFSSGVLSLTPLTHVTRTLSLEAPITPLGDASIPESIATELETHSVHTLGISKRPISQTGNTHSFNYERQCMDTVSHTVDQFSPHSSVRNLTADCVPVQVPTQQYDKSRRVLSLPTVSSVLNVSMRGAVDVVDVISLRHRRTLKVSGTPGELVDDACLLQAGNSYLAVLGHAREQTQLSLCRIPINMNRCDASWLTRPWGSGKKGGISAIAPMLQPLQFATGGYDHVVHLWEVKADLSTASPRPLAIKHSSQIQSLLAIRDTSHKLITAAADCNVHFWDLSSERAVNTVKTSNAPYHAHSTASPFCTLLEVAHRELQFEVRDHRLVPERPVQRFGYTAENVHGRFIKGDTMSNLFACGGRDGRVRLWDTRHLKAAAETVDHGQGQKITQVLFHQSRVIVCSQNGQMYIFKRSI